MMVNFKIYIVTELSVRQTEYIHADSYFLRHRFNTLKCLLEAYNPLLELSNWDTLNLVITWLELRNLEEARLRQSLTSCLGRLTGKCDRLAVDLN